MSVIENSVTFWWTTGKWSIKDEHFNGKTKA